MRRPSRSEVVSFLRLLVVGVDSRGTTDNVPPAPTPTYDEKGNLQLEWLIVARFDPARKVVTISWTKDGDLYRQTKRGAVALEPGDSAGITDAIERTVRMLADPTLF